MTKELQDKLKNWLIKNPDKAEPVDIAAEALAIKRALATEQWRNHNDHQLVLLELDMLCANAYNLYTRLANYRCKKQATLEYLFAVATGKAQQDYLQEDWMRYASIAGPHKKEFLKRAKNLSQNRSPSLQELDRKIIGLTRLDHYGKIPDVVKVFQHGKTIVQGFLTAQNHAIVMQDTLKKARPQDGPSNIHEMMLCCLAYMGTMHEAKINYEKIGNTNYKIQNSLDAIDALYTVLDAMNGDIPELQRDAFMQNNAQNIFLELNEDYHIDALTFSGLFNYFLHRNANKLPSDSYALLRIMQERIILAPFLDSLEEQDQTINDEIHDQFIESLNSVLSWLPELETPSAEEVYYDHIQQITARLNGTKRLKQALKQLEDTRNNRPKNMKEVVVFHYPEPPTIRKARKHHFSNKKKEFLQQIAQQNKHELLEMGLNKEQISQMRKLGKIPAGLPLTVEHIVDREHGGTNQEYNFILMPEYINTKKDKLKKQQVNYQNNPNQAAGS